MSVRLAITCPHCNRPMATSSANSGQTVACPNCRGQFVLNPPGAVLPGPVLPPSPVPATAPSSTAPPATPASSDLFPPSNPNPDLFPPTARSSRKDPSATTAVMTRPLAAPIDDLKLTPVAPPGPVVAAQAPPVVPPTPPAPSANVARFKTAASASPAIAPTADGKLPELLLADSPSSSTGETTDRPVPMWLALIAVVGSTVLSVFLLLGDAPAQQSAQSRRAEVRQEIATFYGTQTANLRPFQVLLREAQQAHSRGDRATERQRYRQVLALLRAEKRNKYENVTGTPSDDDRLAELLSILLASE